MIIISYLIAFAVGALLGDVTLHMIPDIFGGEEGTEEHSIGEEIAPSLFILLGLLLFYLIEKLLNAYGI